MFLLLSFSCIILAAVCYLIWPPTKYYQCPITISRSTPNADIYTCRGATLVYIWDSECTCWYTFGACSTTTFWHCSCEYLLNFILFFRQYMPPHFFCYYFVFSWLFSCVYLFLHLKTQTSSAQPDTAEMMASSDWQEHTATDGKRYVLVNWWGHLVGFIWFSC